jgi:hypothetical protein
LLHRGRADQQQLQQQQLLALQQQQQMAAQQLQQQLAVQQLLTDQWQQTSRRTSSENTVPQPIPALSAAGVEIKFEDLELRRVIGTGQFGLVRVVRHVPTNAVYALKVSTNSRYLHRGILHGMNAWVCWGKWIGLRGYYCLHN